jgi:hypothetical protein
VGIVCFSRRAYYGTPLAGAQGSGVWAAGQSVQALAAW